MIYSIVHLLLNQNMKLYNIPAFMGRSAAALAADLGLSKQALGQYLNGQRGRPSKVVGRLLAACGLNREEIIFPDRFDHPDGENPEHPAYWANVALEALHEAVLAGLPEEEAEKIKASIRAAVAPMLDDIIG
jgi:transcriptional regulator with XRE-family HTH domain